jgi:hypothetical protein
MKGGKGGPYAKLEATIEGTILELLGESKVVGLLAVVLMVEPHDVCRCRRVAPVVVVLLGRQDVGNLF